MPMTTDPEIFFADGCGRCARFATDACSTRSWNAGMRALRTTCLNAGLEETAKWGHPCYMHAGRNVAMLGAFRDDFRLTFFNPALMKDPEAVLEKNGPNTRHKGIIRFTANDQPERMRAVIAAYLEEAMDYARSGILPPRDTAELVLPEELAEALDTDPELAEAFHALTPGRQKSYVINLNGAKKPETRIARIHKFRDKILAGKGAMDR